MIHFLFPWGIYSMREVTWPRVKHTDTPRSLSPGFAAIQSTAYVINPTMNPIWEEIPGEMSLYKESIKVYNFCLTSFSLDDHIPPVPCATSLWTHFTSPSTKKEMK